MKNKNISEKSLSVIKKMQQNELTESVIYKEIARFAKGEENKKTLRRLSREESAHYEIWNTTYGSPSFGTTRPNCPWV